MATVTETALVVRKQDEKNVPELENGDRLTRAEFERRYEAMPRLEESRADRRSRSHALAGTTQEAQQAS